MRKGHTFFLNGMIMIMHYLFIILIQSKNNFEIVLLIY